LCACCVDSWSSLSSGSGGKVLESGQALVAHEPDSQLASARVFSFPASSINDVEGAKSIWPEVSQTGFTRKFPDQGVAPSPMALWPHLFPKVSICLFSSVCRVFHEIIVLIHNLFQTSKQLSFQNSVDYVNVGVLLI